ncbi:MAG: ATP-binding protein [Kiritimatiellae bacterium]|nr:ATP-binding protein [Kiritimatiellia bacterium]
MGESQTIVGREREIDALRDRDSRQAAQFVAVYGRRRVGKTFLITEFFKARADIFFHVTGEKNQPLDRQLEMFRIEMERVFFERQRIPDLNNWNDAFTALNACLAGLGRTKGGPPRSVVVFLDELPWLNTRRSNLVPAIDHAWNTMLKQHPFLRLVICGSAASWMIENIVSDKGGLHNRVSETIRLEPFSLTETEQSLQRREVGLSRHQVLELYMALGGVPFYLDFVRKGDTPERMIARTCFGDGPLVKEFRRLFDALFGTEGHHEEIIRRLAAHPSGVTRRRLLDAMNVQDGGTFSGWLDELREAGFIDILEPMMENQPGALYKVIDPFCLFHLKWMDPQPAGLLSRTTGGARWRFERRSNAYRIWSGCAFENVCYVHVTSILANLGLSHVRCRLGLWRETARRKRRGRPSATYEKAGAQIDLLIDRDDGTISLLEMKYHSKPYRLSAASVSDLMNKRDRFKGASGTSKSIQFVIVTPFGVVDNEFRRRHVHAVVTLDDLFAAGTSGIG